MAKGTFSIQWHITNKCDQRCKHCYIFNRSEPATFQEWDMSTAKALLDGYTEFCLKYGKSANIALTGGDPILHPDFWGIVSEIRSRNIPFVILGNPFHVGPKEAERLVESGCWCYQVSLDGTERTHDSIRKPGSFQATIKWLESAKEWKLRTSVMTTVSRLNYKQVPEVAKLAVDLGVNTYAFARYCPTHDDAELNLSPEEYHAFLIRMWDFYQENVNRGTTFAFKDHLWKALMYEKGILQTNDDDIVYDGCHCGLTHLTLLENGDIYACRRMESKVGHFPEDSLEQVFFGDELQKYREIEQIEGCGTCKLLRFCRGCRAVAYGTAGDFLAKDPQCWICSKASKKNRAH